MLKGKKILVGVTAGIAAYKTAVLIRLLKKNGAEVRVVTTPSTAQFVAPLTFSTLSQNPVVSSFTKSAETGEWNNHVELSLWPDLFVVAPLTANTLAKMATGLCDNLLMATYLSARCPVLAAPAMDLEMYKHPTTSANLKTVEGHGVSVIPAGKGELASGLEGEGRMAEPEEILEQVVSTLKKKQHLAVKGSWLRQALLMKNSTRCGLSETTLPGKWAMHLPRKRLIVERRLHWFWGLRA